MANIVVLSDANKIYVEFGVYADINIPIEATYKVVNITYIQLFNNRVIVFILGQGEWQLDVTGVNGLIVDSVNGIEPTDNEDLYHLLSDL
jgi:hypothetical protein